MAIIEIEQYGSEKKGGSENKYTIFSIGSGKYGIPVLRTREFLQAVAHDIVQLPEDKPWSKGVINLRGKITPVVDLGLVFGIADQMEINNTTIIVVVEIQKSNALKCWEVKKCSQVTCPGYKSDNIQCWTIAKTLCRGELQGAAYQKEKACNKCEVKNMSIIQIGLLVDSAYRILDLVGSEIEPSSSIGEDASYLSGIGKKEIDGKSELMVILDVDRLIPGI